MIIIVNLGTLSRVDFLDYVHRCFSILLSVFGVLLAKLNDGQVAQSNGPQFVVLNFAARFSSRGEEQFGPLQVAKPVIQRSQL